MDKVTDNAEDPFVVGPLQESDEPSILETFSRVFGNLKSPKFWRWQHRLNPGGCQVWVARDPSGRVVSQFAGIPRRVRYHGESVCFSEIVDSFTDPDLRQGLRRRSLFVRTAEPFVSHYGRPDRNVVMYGLPNPVAWRIGQRFIGYTHLRHLTFLTRGLDGVPTTPEPACGEEVVARVCEHFPPDTDELFEEVAVRHKVLTIRDREYLRWRYESHPERPYRIVEARECDGRLLGLAVLKNPWMEDGVAALVDLMLRPHPAFVGFVRFLESWVAAEGARCFRTVLSEGSEEWAAFLQCGWMPEPSPFRQVVGVYRPDISVDALRADWFTTLGDFDIA